MISLCACIRKCKTQKIVTQCFLYLHIQITLQFVDLNRLVYSTGFLVLLGFDFREMQKIKSGSRITNEIKLKSCILFYFSSINSLTLGTELKPYNHSEIYRFKCASVLFNSWNSFERAIHINKTYQPGPRATVFLVLLYPWPSPAEAAAIETTHCKFGFFSTIDSIKPPVDIWHCGWAELVGWLVGSRIYRGIGFVVVVVVSAGS